MPTPSIVNGSVVEWSTDGGTTYVAIPKRTSLAVPSFQPEYIDITCIESPGGVREYITGLIDTAEITAAGFYLPDLYEQAEIFRAAATNVPIRVTLPLIDGQTTTGDVFEFNALITPQIQQNAAGEVLGLDILMRVSGQPTYTKGN